MLSLLPLPHGPVGYRLSGAPGIGSRDLHSRSRDLDNRSRASNRRDCCISRNNKRHHAGGGPGAAALFGFYIETTPKILRSGLLKGARAAETEQEVSLPPKGLLASQVEPLIPPGLGMMLRFQEPDHLLVLLRATPQYARQIFRGRP